MGLVRLCCAGVMLRQPAHWPLRHQSPSPSPSPSRSWKVLPLAMRTATEVIEVVGVEKALRMRDLRVVGLVSILWLGLTCCTLQGRR